jgi:hypothetical protein
MTDSTQLERRVAAHYATEAPDRAPAWVLGRALDAIDSTSQRRVLVRVPWRFPVMNSYAKLAAAALVVLSVGAVGLAVLAPGSSGPGAEASPSPSPSAAPSASASPPASRVRVARFQHPFSYVLPAGADLSVPATYGPAFFELRSPGAFEAGMPSGVIIQAIGGGRADPCAAASDSTPIAPGPDAVIAYLRSIPGLEVSDETTTSVGGLAASQATVTAGEGTPDCPEIYPWDVSPESMPGGVMRVLAVDVGGEHVVFTVYGEAQNPAWDTMADEVISSIEFESEASPSASPSS